MGLKSILMEKVKHSKGLNKIYQWGGGVVIGVLKIFVKTNSKLVLFNSFGGKKFDDSTRAIYLKMKEDPRFESYKLVWAFHNPKEFPEVEHKIQTDDINYFVTMLKARCWISNSSLQRGIAFKGKNTFSFNTWHGTPLKYMGVSTNPHRVNRVMNTCDVILAQSKYEADVFAKDWNISRDKYKIFGLPRNDVLAKCTEEDKQIVRKKLGIPKDNFVILYAPTFRDYLLDSSSRHTLDVPFDYSYWKKLFGDKLTFIFRVHYEVARHNTLPNDSIWMDGSSYPVLDDLMIASDMLISDYSSIMFDYSILGRPIINFLYDYDEYDSKRGLIFDIRKELSWADDSRKLADLVFNMDFEEEKNKVKLFRDKYVEEYGNATEKSIDYIYKILSKE